MSSKVTNLPEGYVRRVERYDYAIAKVLFRPRTAKVNQSLPFRIRLTNVGVTAYGPSSPAPIGIAIIGFSNYVL
jgi:hypothetical protein